MALSAQVRGIWSSARFLVWPDRVVLATFPRLASERVAAFAGRVSSRDSAAFVAFVTEGPEASLTVPEAAFEAWRLKSRALEVVRGLQAISIDASMPVDLVGFFSPLADRLARLGIPIIPQCGFRTDHLLVPVTRLEDARVAIETLIADACREGP